MSPDIWGGYNFSKPSQPIIWMNRSILYLHSSYERVARNPNTMLSSTVNHSSKLAF
ncbi:MAG: hypothetical protein RR471_09660 [Bacteroides sp.]